MKNDMSNTTANPSWWNDTHTTGWERVKEAMSRDWEQTKADFSKKAGHELHQNVGDTVKQATGSAPIPPGNQPVREDWKRAEPAVRYGYGARSYYSDHSEWNDGLESKMRTDWDNLKTGRDWADARTSVRHGWDSAKRKL